MPIQKGTIVIKDYDCVSVGKRRRPGGLCELSLDSTDAVIFVLRMPVGYKRTDEELAEIASKYDVLKDFRENDESSYTIIRKRGLFDKLCGRMKRANRELTDDVLTEIAKQYHTRKEFMEADPSAYSTACRRGILDRICEHMERFSMPMGYWTKERCREEAKKYKTRTEFNNGSPSAVGAAQKNGWLDEICSHMEAQGNWFQRKVYVFTFSDGYAYVGLAQDPEDRYRHHTTPQKKNTPVYKHIMKTGAAFEYKLLTDWLPKDEAAKQEDGYIRKYRADGWKMLNRMKGGGLGSTTKVYTDARIKSEVAKYEYVDDFMNGSPGFYKYVHRHHLTDKYCSGLKYKTKPYRYWTLERAKNAALECSSRSEMRRKHYQAYDILRSSDLLDQCFPKKK